MVTVFLKYIQLATSLTPYHTRFAKLIKLEDKTNSFQIKSILSPFRTIVGTPSLFKFRNWLQGKKYYIINYLGGHC